MLCAKSYQLFIIHDFAHEFVSSLRIFSFFAIHEILESKIRFTKKRKVREPHLRCEENLILRSKDDRG